MQQPMSIEQYERAEVALASERARRGIMIHAAVYVLVQAALVVINLVVASELFWFEFTMFWWGFGISMHLVLGLRRIVD
jgi:hypothetical protein